MFRCVGCLQRTDLPSSLAFWELPRISALCSLIIEAECLEECMQGFSLECKSLWTPLCFCVCFFSALRHSSPIDQAAGGSLALTAVFPAFLQHPDVQDVVLGLWAVPLATRFQQFAWLYLVLAPAQIPLPGPRAGLCSSFEKEPVWPKAPLRRQALTMEMGGVLPSAAPGVHPLQHREKSGFIQLNLKMWKRQRAKCPKTFLEAAGWSWVAGAEEGAGLQGGEAVSTSHFEACCCLCFGPEDCQLSSALARDLQSLLLGVRC